MPVAAKPQTSAFDDRGGRVDASVDTISCRGRRGWHQTVPRSVGQCGSTAVFPDDKCRSSLPDPLGTKRFVGSAVTEHGVDVDPRLVQVGASPHDRLGNRDRAPGSLRHPLIERGQVRGEDS